MATGELNGVDWRHPAFSSVARLGQTVATSADPVWMLNRQAVAATITTAAGAPIRFVGAGDAPAETAYEVHIAQSGRVPTRVNRHDLFNAIVWLSFPRAKARLNALQAAAIARDGIRPQRGPLRDAATLFDENGVIVLARDGTIAEDLRARRWQRLFIGRRADWTNVRVIVFGHALLDKLVAPYKAITGHALLLPSLPPETSTDEVDRVLAHTIDEGLAPSAFVTFPLLGIPGWCDANADPAFYDDDSVFRAARGTLASRLRAAG